MSRLWEERPAEETLNSGSGAGKTPCVGTQSSIVSERKAAQVRSERQGHMRLVGREQEF